jgi:hypothetical protein
VYRGDIDKPKTTKSAREVGLSDGLREDLAAWLVSSPETDPDGWLFPSETLKAPSAKARTTFVAKCVSMDCIYRRLANPSSASASM